MVSPSATPTTYPVMPAHAGNESVSAKTAHNRFKFIFKMSAAYFCDEGEVEGDGMK